MATDPDAPIRAAAFEALRRLVARYGEILPWDALTEGFTHDGQTVLFANRARGIFKPRQMIAGALSIKTTIPKAGRVARYDDLASEGGFVYRYQGADPDAHDNQALAYCDTLRAPLIYFRGVAPGYYLPLWPVFVVRMDPASLSCEVVVGAGNDLARSESTEVLRERTVAAKPHYEQAILRFRTLDAWGERCAVCGPTLGSLLDASVVDPARAVRGSPEEDNALALCVLHREVFDRDLLGIQPSGKVHLASTLQSAGALYEQALRPFTERPVTWPAKGRGPREEYLQARFERFLRTG